MSRLPMYVRRRASTVRGGRAGRLALVWFAFAGLAGATGTAVAQEAGAARGEPLGPEAVIGRPADPAPPSAVAPQLAEAQAAEAADGIVVYFATNRTPVPATTRPDRFDGRLRDVTVFGRAVVDRETFELVDGSIEVQGGPVAAALAEPQALASAALAPASVAERALPVPATGPLAAFAARALRPETDVLVAIHGAGHTFESGLGEAARLATSYRRDGTEILTLVFTYPTNGRGTPLGYLFDRLDAERSGAAMAEAFDLLVGYLDAIRPARDGRTVLVGHSLGVYAMREGAQALADRRTAGEPVFDAAFLMAGDEDADTLSAPGKLRPLLALAGSVSVYFAPNDLLMVLSGIANARAPIGRRGPTDVSVADYEGVPVSTVNAQAFAFDGDRRGHSYHWRSPRVVDDVRAAFAGTPADDIPGRVRIAPRVYQLVPVGEERLVAARAASPAAPEPPRYLYVPDADAVGEGEGVHLLDPAEPDAGAVVVLEPDADAADRAAVRSAVLSPGAELLPGRYDEILVAVARDDGAEGAVLVASPSTGYLSHVLPTGFSPEEAIRLAGPSEGELRIALGPETLVVVPERVDGSSWTGAVTGVVEGAGPPTSVTGSAVLAFADDGVTGCIGLEDGRTFVVEAAPPDPAGSSAVDDPGGFALVREVAGADCPASP